MAITKNMVDAMGVTIDVESELGQGSCFEGVGRKIISCS